MLPHYPDYEHLLAQLQLTCFMLAMGATLAPAEFVRVLKKPRFLVAAAIGQLLVLPLLAYGIAHLVGLEGGLAVGLILVSVMPGGAISKFFAFLGRGNVALSITLSVFTTLAAIITVPLSLRLFASEYIPPDFEMPTGKMVRELALFLLLPLLVGMVLGRFWPKPTQVLSRWSVRIGFVLIGLIVVGSLSSGRIRPMEYGLTMPIVLIVYCLVGMQINMTPFYIMRWPRADRLAAGIEVTMRNMNLAVLLNTILFPPTKSPEMEKLNGEVLFVVLFNAGVAMGAGALLAFNHRRMSRRELPAAIDAPAEAAEPR